MTKGRHSLNFHFAVILAFFSFFLILFSALATYLVQTKNFRKVSEKNIVAVGDYLLELIKMQPDDFIEYQNYYMEHCKEVDIPYSFSEYTGAKAVFEKIVSRETEAGLYPDGWTVKTLSPEAKKAWFIYMHEYWLLTFEKSRKSFNLPYTYYLVPKEDTYKVVYMIDGERSLKERDGKSYLLLGDEYYNDPQLYDVEWATWFTGKRQSSFQEWNNAWGHTSAFYMPLVIDGKKYGMIGSEFSVTTVNRDILRFTINEVIVLLAILFVCVTIVLIVINKRYISKIVRLEAYVRKYSVTKNYKIAEKIEEDSKDLTEISSLGKRISEMIIEIENYMRNVFMEHSGSDQDYASVRETDLLRRDALTGIRTGASFEKELAKLENERQEGLKDFGFVYVDINDLSKINSNYGLERGNIAIKKLCSIVCKVFEHSPVFRLGGDDFVAILYNDDINRISELIAEFNDRLILVDETIEPWEDISASIGVALYDAVQDGNVESVLNRAEINMRNTKKMMKARLKF